MRRRVAKRKRQRIASSKGDGEPPDSSTTMGKILLAEAGPIGWAKWAMDASKPKPVAMPAMATPLAAESTVLKPGQKTSGVVTGPQGLLGPATVGRQSLLGS